MDHGIYDIAARMLDEPNDRQWLHAIVQNLDDTNATYFLCPDAHCELFSKPDCHVPCEKECPHKAEKAIVCHRRSAQEPETEGRHSLCASLHQAISDA